MAARMAAKWERLPDELLHGALSWLSPSDLVACSGTARWMRSAARDGRLWRKHCERLWRAKFMATEMPSVCAGEWWRIYAAAVVESRRGPSDLDLETELPRLVFRMRFNEEIDMPWLGIGGGDAQAQPAEAQGAQAQAQTQTQPQPQAQARPTFIRRFLPRGVYWAPRDDPIFAHFAGGWDRPRLRWIAFRNKDETYIQLVGRNFPPMRMTRDPDTWEWVLRGAWTTHRTYRPPPDWQGWSDARALEALGEAS